jgi:hypothetical protein
MNNMARLDTSKVQSNEQQQQTNQTEILDSIIVCNRFWVHQILVELIVLARAMTYTTVAGSCCRAIQQFIFELLRWH